MQSFVYENFKKLFTLDLTAKLVNFLCLPIYLNLMNIEEFGYYSYLTGMLMAIVYISGLGQHAVINRYFNSEEYGKRELTNVVVLISAASTLLSILLMNFCENLILTSNNNDLHNVFNINVVAAIALISYTANYIFNSFIVQYQCIKLIQTKILLELIAINLVSIIVLYYIERSKLEARMLVVGLLQISILIYVMKNINWRLILRINEVSKQFLFKALRNGIPIAVGSLSNIFIVFGDRIFTEKNYSKIDLGIYSFAVTISGIILIVFQSFHNAWTPRFFSQKNMGKSLTEILLILKYIFISITILTLVEYWAIEVFTEFLIDKNYVNSKNLIVILNYAMGAQAFGMLIANYYQVLEKNYIPIPLNILFGAFNYYVAKYFFENYDMGLYGVALAVLLTSVGLAISHLIIVCRIIQRGVRGEYFTDIEK